MRQAGRYLPEYRRLRGDEDILDTCRDPAKVVELTLQPLARMPLDAAILFSDIMVPLAAVGLPVRIEPGRGPVVDDPIRDATAIRRLRPLEPDTDEPWVIEATRLASKELTVPLIGFSGAPFTLASYLVEGGPSRDLTRTRALLLSDPEAWRALMEALVAIVVPHLRVQAEAGAGVLQLFDSWVGAVGPDDYRRSVAPHVKAIADGLRDLDVLLVHFGVGTGELLPQMADAAGDMIGVDRRTPLDAAWERVGDRAVQGNLDPVALLAPWKVLASRAREVLRRAGGRDGHVFNLGHGVLPGTPVEALQRLVDLVHEESERAA
jgi:uroporphyrinogen decarboxylase